MQDRRTPPPPSDVTDIMDNEILEGDIEEVIELDDSIFESASSSENENEDSSTEDLARGERLQKDDSVSVFRGHASSKRTALIFTRDRIYEILTLPSN